MDTAALDRLRMNLRNSIRQAGLKQESFAVQIGVDKQTFTKWINGHFRGDGRAMNGKRIRFVEAVQFGMKERGWLREEEQLKAVGNLMLESAVEGRTPEELKAELTKEEPTREHTPLTINCTVSPREFADMVRALNMNLLSKLFPDIFTPFD